MKRLGIFLFFDAHGEVSDFITHYLLDFKKNLSQLIIVVNGRLSDEGRSVLDTITDQILVRPNKGFDAWAFKEVFEHYGYDFITNHDEIVLSNSTCYGPLYPFSRLFAKMDGNPCDFWGITSFPRVENLKFSERQASPHVDEHIQSYFIVIRDRMLKSPDFKKFWDNIPEISSFEEAVSLYEIVFTKHFENLGFKWDVLVKPDNYQQIPNVSLNCPVETIRDDANPFLKRKVFSLGNRIYMEWGQISIARDCLEYLDRHHLYDTDLIISDMLRTQPLSLLRKSFHWNYIMPDAPGNSENGKPHIKIGAIFHFTSTDNIRFIIGHLASLHENATCILLAETKRVAEELKQYANDSSITLLACDEEISSVRLLLKAFRALKTAGVELVCYANDYMAAPPLDYLIAHEALEFSYLNGLKDRASVSRIASLFERKRLLGCLLTPNLTSIGTQGSFSSKMPKLEPGQVKGIIRELGIENLCKNEPLEYVNNVAWLRLEALQQIADKLHHSDLLHNSDFKTIRQIISLLPYAAQQAGYYTGQVVQQEAAECLLDCIREEAEIHLEKITPQQHIQKEYITVFADISGHPLVRVVNSVVKTTSLFIPIAKYRRKFRRRYKI